MNCSDLEACLADYLAGELEASSVRAVEAHLAGCSRCAAEVTGLRSVIATLDAARLPPDALAEMSRRAPLRIPPLNVPAENAGRPRRRRLRTLLAPLGYAAAIGLAFYLGYWWRGGAVHAADSGPSNSASPMPSADNFAASWGVESVSPAVAARFEAAAAAFPKSSTFSRSLLAFSRR